MYIVFCILNLDFYIKYDMPCRFTILSFVRRIIIYHYALKLKEKSFHMKHPTQCCFLQCNMIDLTFSNRDLYMTRTS